LVDLQAFWTYNKDTYTKELEMAQKGLIRIAVGFLLVFGAVGGMEQQPEASLTLQMIAAITGLALMMWAARDINRQTGRTLAQLAKNRYN
jgi:hypothetical protein